MHLIAKIYAGAIASAALWAWWAELLSVPRAQEHLLPAMLLMFLTAPTSLLLGPLYDAAPSLLGRPLIQLSAITVLAAIQVAMVWRIVKWYTGE